MSKCKQYMVIERFREGCFDAVYRRFEDKGRMLPDKLRYVDSWVSKEKNICFQLMETENESLFVDWISQWDDLVEFEIVPLN